MTAPQPIRLVMTDVDGTLLTAEKELTPKAHEAVMALYKAGIKFSIVSGRPPRGMHFLLDELKITEPVAAYNGGLFMKRDGTVIAEYPLPEDKINGIIDKMKHYKLDVWVYTANDWFLRDMDAPHVAKEIKTVRFDPAVVKDFSKIDAPILKITGISDDLGAVAKCEQDLHDHFNKGISASCSQPYYLDATHTRANKGHLIQMISEYLSISRADIATLGDAASDVSMFVESGMSIAMGQANPEVQNAAKHVTTSNEDEGFANAINQFVLKFN